MKRVLSLMLAALAATAGQAQTVAPPPGDLKAVAEVRAVNGGRAAWAVQDVGGAPTVSLYAADRTGVRSVVLYFDEQQLQAMKTAIDASIEIARQRRAATPPRP